MSKFTPIPGQSSPAQQREQNKHEVTLNMLSIVKWVLLAIIIGSFVTIGVLLYKGTNDSKDYIQPFVTLLASIVTGVLGLLAGHRVQKD